MTDTPDQLSRVRVCQECGTEYAKSRKDSLRVWATRKFCGKKCMGMGRTRRHLSIPAFWERVQRSGPEQCWEWIGSKTAGGYGNMRVAGDKNDYAHRFAYELLVGPIHDGLVIDHLCRNRACVNPAHLEPVPPAENVRRGLAPYGLRTTCRHGHDITKPENVYVAPRGDRRCAVCQEIANARRRIT